jgi:hypothetical protein
MDSRWARSAARSPTRPRCDDTEERRRSGLIDVPVPFICYANVRMGAGGMGSVAEHEGRVDHYRR